MPASFTHPALPRGHCHGWSTAQPGRGAPGFRSFQLKRPKPLGKAFASRMLGPSPNALPVFRRRLFGAGDCAGCRRVRSARCRRADGAPGDSDTSARGEAVRIGRLALPQARRVSRTAGQPRGTLLDLLGGATDHRLEACLRIVEHRPRHRAGVVPVHGRLQPGASRRVAQAGRRPADPMRLVFLATPGPGGGGGGGGLCRKRRRRRRCAKDTSDQQPAAHPARAEAARSGAGAAEPKPPPPPLKAEPLPAVVAPIITAPADTRNRVGVLQEDAAENDEPWPRRRRRRRTGTGTGLGEGDGSGIGPGSGGGTGGGPYRPGSGIEPPRLLREVNADYTEDARQRGAQRRRRARNRRAPRRHGRRRQDSAGARRRAERSRGAGGPPVALRAGAPAGYAGGRHRRSRGGVQAPMTPVAGGADRHCAGGRDERRRVEPFSRRATAPRGARRRAGRRDPRRAAGRSHSRRKCGDRRDRLCSRRGSTPARVRDSPTVAAVGLLVFGGVAALAVVSSSALGRCDRSTRIERHRGTGTGKRVQDRASRARRAGSRTRRRSTDCSRRRPQSCIGHGAGPLTAVVLVYKSDGGFVASGRAAVDSTVLGLAAKRRSPSPSPRPPRSAATA